LIAGLLYRSEELDKNIAVGIELAEFPTENALYQAAVKRYEKEDLRIRGLEASGEISQEDLKSAKKIFGEVSVGLYKQYDQRLKNAKSYLHGLGEEVTASSQVAIDRFNDVNARIRQPAAIMHQQLQLTQEEARHQGASMHR
jgi:hypothetical protein